MVWQKLILLVVVTFLFALSASCTKKKPTEPEESSKGEVEWEKTFGGNSDDIGYSVQQTADGGFIIVGSTKSFGAGHNDIYFIKTSASGDAMWTKMYGDIDNDYGYSVDQTSDGGYIISGATLSFGAGGYDIYLLKTDSNGDTIWTKTFGGDYVDIGYAVEQTSDGGYIISGVSWNAVGSCDAYLLKTDETGDSLWANTYGGEGYDYFFSVQETSDGGYIATGYTTLNGMDTSLDIYLVKTDVNGNEMWTRRYGGNRVERGSSVQVTFEGGYIISGYTETFGPGYYDVYIIKTDINGDSLWTKAYGWTGEDYGNSVHQTLNGGYIVAGSTKPFNSGYYEVDIYVLLLDTKGDTLWTKTYGGAKREMAYSVQQTSDRGYVIAGYTQSYGGGGSDVYLIKIKP